MLALLMIALLAAATDDTEPAQVRDGGVCVGIAWVTLRPGEKVVREPGPDFSVFRFEGPDHRTWGAYSGNAAQVHANGPLLLKRDGVEVHRAVEDSQFRGYLAHNKQGWQNHFFGSVFTGAAADKAFFDRIDFGKKGQALCAKDR
jgi:hypothetical protein